MFAGNQSCSEIKDGKALLYSLCPPSHHLDLNIMVSVLSFMFPDTWRGWYRCPIYSWAFSGHLFSAFWPVINFYSYWCPQWHITWIDVFIDSLLMTRRTSPFVISSLLTEIWSYFIIGMPLIPGESYLHYAFGKVLPLDLECFST